MKRKKKAEIVCQISKFIRIIIIKKNENNKKIIQLYSIVFIKCFLNKLVYICLKDEQKIGVLSEYNKIIAGDNYFKNSIKMYILKLIFDIKGNFNDFSSTDFHFHEFKFIVEKEINKFLHTEDVSQLDSSQNIYGFDYLIIPLIEDNKNDFAEFLKDLYEIKINNMNDSKLMKNLNKNNGIDFLYCGLLNTLFSFYYKNNENKKISQWILQKINKGELEILNKNELLKKNFIIIN